MSSQPTEIQESYTKWTYICETQNLTIEEWRKTADGAPTTCMYGSGHTLTSGSINDWATISPLNAHISHVDTENVKNRIRYRGDKIVCSANQTTSFDISFNMNITAKFVESKTTDDQKDDIIHVYRNHNDSLAPYGIVLTQDISVNDEYVYLHANFFATVVADEGMQLVLEKSGTKYNLGDITEVDVANLRVKMATPISEAFTVAGTTVRFTIPICENYVLNDAAMYSLGRETMNSTYFEKGQIITVLYENKSLLTSKNFYYYLAYFW